MMNEPRSMSIGSVDAAITAPPHGATDWRAVADQRLTRLVEIEHDHAVMLDRLALLQVDYREVLVAGEDRLRQISELDRARVNLEGRLADLADEHARMKASFEGSRSWRLTRPLRAISAGYGQFRHGSGGFVRSMLRVPVLRRVARLLVRVVPGLHQRLRSRLYPQPGRDRHGNFH